MNKFKEYLDKAFADLKIESDIWDEECGYCDNLMNICNHTLNSDKYARCKQQTCPILHPELIS